MTATFEIIINSIRTANEGGFTGVIKRAGWTIKGTQNGQTFELVQETQLGEVDPANFTPLASITDPAPVIAWIEAAEPNLQAIKDHVQFVLDRECARVVLNEAPLPWTVVPETVPAE